MTTARKLELFVGIPAWLVCAIAMFTSEVRADMPWWGYAGLCLFFATWIGARLLEEWGFWRG